MKRSKWKGVGLSFVAAAWALSLPACGGRSVSRPATTAEAPPIADWQRPSRMGNAEPAVRLDRPAPESSAGEPSSASAETGRAGRGAVQAIPGERTNGSTRGARVNLEPGMTLYSLARAYQVPLKTIMKVNGIEDPTAIRAGTEIYIPSAGDSKTPARSHADRSVAGAPAPGASVPAPAGEPGASPSLMSIAWPLDGRITGGFGLRTRHHHHDGIDIDGVKGEEVHAVAPGVVVRSGYDGKYGKTVVIDHGNGLTTLYAHASRLRVHEGDEVDQGETIAEVGATGNARGTHLHFEVRRDGRPVDPVPYLKPETVGTSSR